MPATITISGAINSELTPSDSGGNLIVNSDGIQLVSMQAVNCIKGAIKMTGGLAVALTLPTIVQPTAYIGDYTVTPSGVAQVLETEGKRMTSDLVINPVPQQYGLITWNGSIITVS